MLSAERLALERSAGPQVTALLHATRRLLLALLEEPLHERPVVPLGEGMTTFLQLLIGFSPSEALYLLQLDKSGRLICCDEIARGTPTSVECDPRKIVLRALERGATGIILVHNHPAGDPEPSSLDRSITRRIADLASGFEIAFHDHIIVARGRARSVL
jgi:DNA repair protein RadC